MSKTSKVGRPYPTHTRLGKVMWHRDWTVYELAGEAGVAPRTLTEYLAGRMPISSTNLVRLARALNCKPEHLIEPVEIEAAS